MYISSVRIQINMFWKKIPNINWNFSSGCPLQIHHHDYCQNYVTTSQALLTEQRTCYSIDCMSLGSFSVVRIIYIWIDFIWFHSLTSSAILHNDFAWSCHGKGHSVRVVHGIDISWILPVKMWHIFGRRVILVNSYL